MSCHAVIGLPKLTHEAPELESKALLQRVEGQVAARALGVVVWAGELGTGRLEAAAGNERRGRGGAESSAGEHLEESVSGAIGVVDGRTLDVLQSGEVAEGGRGGAMMVIAASRDVLAMTR
jgi:hypothetical protein